MTQRSWLREHERTALAHEINDGGRVVGAEADDVAQARDLIRARALDRCEHRLERCHVAVDVGGHGDAHRHDGSSDGGCSGAWWTSAAAR